jgi:hypothetical protein
MIVCIQCGHAEASDGYHAPGGGPPTGFGVMTYISRGIAYTVTQHCPMCGKEDT